MSLTVGIISQLILIKFTHCLYSLIRLTNGHIYKFKLVRPHILSSAVVIKRKLLYSLELFLGSDDHQATAHAVGKDLRLCAVRRNFIVEQVFCQLDHFLGIAILKPQQSHLTFDWLGSCCNGSHDLLYNLELFLGRCHDQPAAWFVRQDHRPGYTSEFRVLHSLVN